MQNNKKIKTYPWANWHFHVHLPPRSVLTDIVPRFQTPKVPLRDIFNEQNLLTLLLYPSMLAIVMQISRKENTCYFSDFTCHLARKFRSHVFDIRLICSSAPKSASVFTFEMFDFDEFDFRLVLDDSELANSVVLVDYCIS